MADAPPSSATPSAEYVAALEAKYKKALSRIEDLEKQVEDQASIIDTYKLKVSQIYQAVMARKHQLMLPLPATPADSAETDETPQDSPSLEPLADSDEGPSTPPPEHEPMPFLNLPLPSPNVPDDEEKPQTSRKTQSLEAFPSIEAKVETEEGKSSSFEELPSISDDKAEGNDASPEVKRPKRRAPQPPPKSSPEKEKERTDSAEEKPEPKATAEAEKSGEGTSIRKQPLHSPHVKGGAQIRRKEPSAPTSPAIKREQRPFIKNLKESFGRDKKANETHSRADGIRQLEILNTLLSSPERGQDYGLPPRVDDKIWRLPTKGLSTDWPAFKEETQEKLLIKNEEGYLREQGAGSLEDEKNPFPLIEEAKYQYYYKTYFYGRPHTVYVSDLEDQDSKTGPVVIACEPSDETKINLKVLILTKKGVDKLSIPVGSGRMKTIRMQRPYLEEVRLYKVNKKSDIKEALLKYDERSIQMKYKFGILYGKAGQNTENEMFHNEHGSETFNEFLDFLGERINLQGFTGYNGGLDVKQNSTGLQSITTKYAGCDIMFHVSTLLAYFPADVQQVERKRHLGNDVVLVIFREGENEPFSPKVIHSQFNHIFLVVTPERNPETNKVTGYRIAMSCKYGVPVFGPSIPESCVINKDEKGRDWFLSKMINGERASFHAADFVIKFRDTRKKQLLNIIEEYQNSVTKTQAFSTVSKTTGRFVQGTRIMWSKMGTSLHSPSPSQPVVPATQQTYASIPENLFEVKYKNKAGNTEPAIFEVSPTRVALLGIKDGSIKEQYPLNQIRRWVVSDTEDICQFDFGDFRDGYLVLGTPKKNEIDTMLTGFIESLMNREDITPIPAHQSTTTSSASTLSNSKHEDNSSGEAPLPVPTSPLPPPPAAAAEKEGNQQANNTVKMSADTKQESAEDEREEKPRSKTLGNSILRRRSWSEQDSKKRLAASGGILAAAPKKKKEKKKSHSIEKEGKTVHKVKQIMMEEKKASSPKEGGTGSKRNKKDKITFEEEPSSEPREKEKDKETKDKETKEKDNKDKEDTEERKARPTKARSSSSAPKFATMREKKPKNITTSTEAIAPLSPSLDKRRKKPNVPPPPNKALPPPPQPTTNN